jgi:tetratricopeptide (TPR) repeat protein
VKLPSPVRRRLRRVRDRVRGRSARQVEEIERAMGEGDWERAERMCALAVNGSLRPPSRVLALHGQVLSRLERWPAAIRAYERALDSDGPPDWYYALARAQLKSGNPVAAELASSKAVVLAPNQPRYWERLGRAALSLGEWEKARSCYRRAQRLRMERTGSPRIRTVREFERLIDLGAIPRANYAYCLLKGARLASKLGVDRISVLEFGVAGGNGLLALEDYADVTKELLGVEIDVVGFDTGEGLYEPEDVRDMPYFFSAGNYAMDVPALRSRLRSAELILGDARETFADFLDQDRPPIGAISFDMDYYSATVGVLSRMGDESKDDAFLPRVPLYFDDVVGKRNQDYNDFTGELLAIQHFNEVSGTVKVAEDRYFRRLPLNLVWHHSMYLMHRFQHPHYETNVSAATSSSLGLRTPVESA